MSIINKLRNLINPQQDAQAAEKQAAAAQCPIQSSRDNEKAKRILLLTPRELEAYQLLLEGFTLKETAAKMGIKYPTANTYMTGIYKKLGVNSRAELIINYR